MNQIPLITLTPSMRYVYTLLKKSIQSHVNQNQNFMIFIWLQNATSVTHAHA